MGRVIVPLVSWPITTLSIIVVILSILLAATVLLHKGRGGGMSDLFGGGMSTSMGGASTAERRLDRITVVLGLVWLLTIVGYLFGPETKGKELDDLADEALVARAG